MRIKDRIKLRLNYLKELYRYHYESCGKEKYFRHSLDNDIERERYLAAQYLAEKGLLKLREVDSIGHYHARITAKGIDYLENEIVIE
ncbi:MAG: hypothetical protein N3B21_16520 [Clostridia bacterium]|nr:hypothetical protein [Clostridia bacterium]